MAEMAAESEQYALIAGTGFQSFGDDASSHEIGTEFGAPSCAIRQMEYGQRKVYFLARHGEDLHIPPHAVNYRANLEALRLLGTTHIVAINTVGVIVARQYPGQVAVPRQLIDYTCGREHTIYGGEGGKLEHVLNGYDFVTRRVVAGQPHPSLFRKAM